MHPHQESILEVFAQHNSHPLTTGDIVNYLYPNIESQKDKAKFHRRVLHHIHRLIERNLIRVIQIKAKGERLFAPNLEQTQHFQAQSVTVRQQSVILPVEQYLKQGMVYTYGGERWIEQVNAIVVDCSDESCIPIIRESLHVINDVIILQNIESVVSERWLSEIVKEVIKYCKLHNKRCCILFKFSLIVDDDSCYGFIQSIASRGPSNIILVYEASIKDVHLKKSLFMRVMELYTLYNYKMNITRPGDTRFAIGRAGPYEIPERIGSFCVSQSTIIIDMLEFFQKHKTASHFVKAVIDIAKSLYIAQKYHIRYIKEYFPRLLQSQIDVGSFYQAPTTIRFINSAKVENGLEILKEAKQAVSEYVRIQNRVHVSCGIPWKFKPLFAQGYRGFNTALDAFVTDEIPITGSFHVEKIRTELVLREKLAQFAVSEVRILRKGTVTLHDAFGECNYLLSTYAIPVLCYHFQSETAVTKSLEEFLQ